MRSLVTASVPNASVKYLQRARALVGADTREAIDRALGKINGLPPPAAPKATVDAVEVPAPPRAPAAPHAVQPPPAATPPGQPKPAQAQPGKQPRSDTAVEGFRPSVD